VIRNDGWLNFYSSVGQLNNVRFICIWHVSLPCSAWYPIISMAFTTWPVRIQD